MLGGEGVVAVGPGALNAQRQEAKQGTPHLSMKMTSDPAGKDKNEWASHSKGKQMTKRR